MKRKDEDKKEKRLKILKIVGSAIGLTICTGLVVFLMVIGVRGCASSFKKSYGREASETLSQITLNNVEPKKAITYGEEYIYNYPFNGDKNDVLWQTIQDLAGSSVGSSVSNSNIELTYKDNTIRVNNIAVSLGGANNLYNVLLKDSNNNNVLTFASKLDNNNKWYLTRLTSDVFNFRYYVLDTDTKLPDFRQLKLNIHFVYPGWTDRPYFYTWVEQYFTLKNEVSSPFNLTFNNVINPYGPIGGNYDYFTTSELTGVKTITKGLFKDSEGTFYNEISITYLSATGMRFGTTTEYHTYTGVGSHYVDLLFTKLDGSLVVANAQDFGTALTGDQVNNVVMLKTNHWISSIYQYLTIYDLIEGSNTTNFSQSKTRLAALTSLNNISESTGISGVGGAVGSTGLFTLIGSAFSALVPIFNTQVLPGINLWTLLLVPLLGTIILFVVWLFKR